MPKLFCHIPDHVDSEMRKQAFQNKESLKDFVIRALINEIKKNGNLKEKP